MNGEIDLSIEFCGIQAPNPFWLASAPPTNSGDQIRRAFEAGWGGACWKTLCPEPIVNVSSRYSAMDYEGKKVVGLNNIELITDRPLEDNLREIREIKREFPHHALFVSLMAESKREAWHEMVKKCQDTGADGFELNFGCPHGMNERGMGSAVGQVPAYTRQITEWVKEVSRIPVMVKLTPNVTDITTIGRAAVQGGADALSMMNTVNSIMGVDLHTLSPKPSVNGWGSHGGYSGPAVKPIALNMVASTACDSEIGVPLSGIGGIQAWQDAVEFMLLGASTVQVCTAVMHYGFRMIEPMIRGVKNWMCEHGFFRCRDFIGASLDRIKTWGELDLNYKVQARIDQEKCIHCGMCYTACEDGCYQSIKRAKVPATEFLATGQSLSTAIIGNHEAIAAAGDGYVNVFTVNEETCVGCNMCSLICPVPGCITMTEIPTGKPRMSWVEYQKLLAAGKIDKIQPLHHRDNTQGI